MSSDPGRPFADLDPQRVLEALASEQVMGDGRLLALNSYENRVYLVYLDDGSSVVAKFYRPARWSDAQILEEHRFAQELADAEVPAVPAMLLPNGSTLGHFDTMRFSVSPRRGGRAPELDDEDVLERIGMFLGRMHSVGRQAKFQHRVALTPETMGSEPVRWLQNSDMLPMAQRTAWLAAAHGALKVVEQLWGQVGHLSHLRIHGDCHPGNILWTDSGPHFVDLDDAMQGPAIQDFWMLLDGEPERSRHQLAVLLSGYEQFCEFNWEERRLIEALRTLRMIHHSAWLARRWNDPAFPAAFPWFGTERYWEERLLELGDQQEKMQAAL